MSLSGEKKVRGSFVQKYPVRGHSVYSTWPCDRYSKNSFDTGNSWSSCLFPHFSKLTYVIDFLNRSIRCSAILDTIDYYLITSVFNNWQLCLFTRCVSIVLLSFSFPSFLWNVYIYFIITLQKMRTTMIKVITTISTRVTVFTLIDVIRKVAARDLWDLLIEFVCSSNVAGVSGQNILGSKSY